MGIFTLSDTVEDAPSGACSTIFTIATASDELPCWILSLFYPGPSNPTWTLFVEVSSGILPLGALSPKHSKRHRRLKCWARGCQQTATNHTYLAVEPRFQCGMEQGLLCLDPAWSVHFGAKLPIWAKKKSFSAKSLLESWTGSINSWGVSTVVGKW